MESKKARTDSNRQRVLYVWAGALDKIKSVQVHHITYKNLGNENVLTDICTLCGSCYKKTHNYYNCKRA